MGPGSAKRNDGVRYEDSPKLIALNNVAGLRPASGLSARSGDLSRCPRELKPHAGSAHVVDTPATRRFLQQIQSITTLCRLWPARLRSESIPCVGDADTDKSLGYGNCEDDRRVGWSTGMKNGIADYLRDEQRKRVAQGGVEIEIVTPTDHGRACDRGRFDVALKRDHELGRHGRFPLA